MVSTASFVSCKLFSMGPTANSSYKCVYFYPQDLSPWILFTQTSFAHLFLCPSPNLVIHGIVSSASLPAHRHFPTLLGWGDLFRCFPGFIKFRREYFKQERFPLPSLWARLLRWLLIALAISACREATYQYHDRCDHTLLHTGGLWNLFILTLRHCYFCGWRLSTPK